MVDGIKVRSGVSGADGTNSDPPANAFDGDLTKYALAPPSSLITVTLPGGTITGVTSLRVYFQSGNWTAGATDIFQVNGVDLAAQVGSDAKWYDITGVTSLTSIGYGTNASSSYSLLYAVEVNGKLLVDSSVSNPDAVINHRHRHNRQHDDC